MGPAEDGAPGRRRSSGDGAVPGPVGRPCRSAPAAVPSVVPPVADGQRPVETASILDGWTGVPGQNTVRVPCTPQRRYDQPPLCVRGVHVPGVLVGAQPVPFPVSDSRKVEVPPTWFRTLVRDSGPRTRPWTRHGTDHGLDGRVVGVRTPLFPGKGSITVPPLQGRGESGRIFITVRGGYVRTGGVGPCGSCPHDGRRTSVTTKTPTPRSTDLPSATKGPERP